MDEHKKTPAWRVETYKVECGKKKRDGWYWMVRALSQGGPYRSEAAAKKAGASWVDGPHSEVVMQAAAARILR